MTHFIHSNKHHLYGYLKIGGNDPKMDGENNGKPPYEEMDDLGGFQTPIFASTPIYECLIET